MHSALKRDGKPLYEYARQGITLDGAARRADIHAIDLRGLDGDKLCLSVDCSKGTYIRTLAEDIGAALGCGAHLAALRRTRIGRLGVDQAVALAELEAMVPDRRDALLTPIDALLEGLPRAELGEADAVRLRQGQAIRWNGLAGRWRAYAGGAFSASVNWVRTVG